MNLKESSFLGILPISYICLIISTLNKKKIADNDIFAKTMN